MKGIIMSFRIRTPNGIHYVYNETNLKFEDKLKIVNELLEKHKNYISNYKNNITNLFLIDCANFLLLGEKNNVISKYKEQVVKLREIPISNINNKNIENMIYSSFTEEAKDENINRFNVKQINQNFIDYRQLLIQEFYTEKKTNKIEKLWKNSRNHKLNLLYSCDEKIVDITDDTVVTYKVDPNHISEILFCGEIQKGIPKTIKKKVVDKREGIINENTIVKWVLPNQYNEFNFNNHKFVVWDEKYKTYNNGYKLAEMNYILCVYNKCKDTYYFFNENIDEITNKVKIKNNN